MDNENGIINRVASSALVTFDLESYYQSGERVVIDLKAQLFQELILKEKDFRQYIKSHSWGEYRDKYVAITCTADAIVPTWAFMLVAVALQPYARHVTIGSLEDLEVDLYRSALQQVDWNFFSNAKVVVKGCSKIRVPLAAYVEATTKLSAVAASLMFGEPCSTVPLYKRSKTH